MSAIGYARVSSTDQDLTIQLEALKQAGCTLIRSEKATGTSTKGRTELASILEFIRADDELVVTRIDRLARSIGRLKSDPCQMIRPTRVRPANRSCRFQSQQPISLALAAASMLSLRPCERASALHLSHWCAPGRPGRISEQRAAGSRLLRRADWSLSHSQCLPWGGARTFG